MDKLKEYLVQHILLYMFHSCGLRHDVFQRRKASLKVLWVGRDTAHFNLIPTVQPTGVGRSWEDNGWRL